MYYVSYLLNSKKKTNKCTCGSGILRTLVEDRFRDQLKEIDRKRERERERDKKRQREREKREREKKNRERELCNILIQALVIGVNNAKWQVH